MGRNRDFARTVAYDSPYPTLRTPYETTGSPAPRAQ